jgi:hypothetical protein
LHFAAVDRMIEDDYDDNNTDDEGHQTAYAC